VIRICSKCGALLLDDSESCSFCNAPPEPIAKPRPPAAARAGSDHGGEPEWRLEVSRRLQEYRERRGLVRPNESQSGLPFHAVADDDLTDVLREHPRPPRPSSRSGKSERVEIRVQSELDFSSGLDDRAHPQTALVPVATLAERRWAGAIDFVFLALTCAGFLGLFRSLGGEILLDKTNAVIYMVIAYLFYGLYFSIFITLAGSTPGMQLRGLSVVRLDGHFPETRQLLWRSFGYLLSGATLALGFVWAIWDEDRFTWQDRMSHTYITAAVPLSDSEGLEVSPEHTFAHK